jgi:hypothetical protein
MASRYRCPQCRTRRTDWLSLLAHIEKHGHKVCRCGGYAYAHRPGSPYCHENPWSIFNEAYRAGEPTATLLDIAIHIAYENPGKADSSACPF